MYLQIPIVGFGLWKVNNDTCADQVYNAIKTGYRLFDGACDYGNEVEAGQGVKRAIDEGLVKREDLTIVSKLWYAILDRPEQVRCTNCDFLQELFPRQGTSQAYLQEAARGLGHRLLRPVHRALPRRAEIRRSLGRVPAGLELH